ncbi:polysaccharide deacetylase family protein [Marinimicrobium sp. LS-A18]|uniref:polysaccharide deacetylase family protein n=1 Tax=Marinimicrobium sp. LS-A18 TaxID=1381596 RepID=UPI0004B3218C|nr:polysaccharide deacetylase family protein [Marinimicrobium sp. LS-A18]
MLVTKPVRRSLALVALVAGVLGLLLSLAAGSPAQAAVVLQYHHVSESTPASTSVTPKRFRSHMDYLESHDFDVVPLEALVEALRSGEPLPDRTVAITFDDAYESVYSAAYPMLKERGWPFTVFVNTDPLDQGKGGFTSWDQLREMAEHGATIANHSTKHNHLQRRKAGESQGQWRERIESEVVDAERRIKEETGQNHKMLAYPYGEYNNEVKDLLASLGYVAFGQQSGPIGDHSDLRALPRFPFGGPYGEIEEFATKAQTRAMPIESVELYADSELEQPLDEVVVAAGARPVLVLNLEQDNLAGRINCFAGGQGAIETRVEGRQLITQPGKPLTPGRTRYNCTAGTGESGRFYWFSQQWLVTDKDGRWVHEN